MKKLLPGLLAVVVAISLSAFSVQKTHTASFSGEKWFVFNGVDPDDLQDPSMYSLDGDGSAATVCTRTDLQYRCEIFAKPSSSNSSEPDLATIQSQTKRTTP